MIAMLWDRWTPTLQADHSHRNHQPPVAASLCRITAGSRVDRPRPWDRAQRHMARRTGNAAHIALAWLIVRVAITNRQSAGSGIVGNLAAAWLPEPLTIGSKPMRYTEHRLKLPLPPGGCPMTKDTPNVTRMDIVLHVSPHGGFQLFAPAGEIEVDQIIAIPTGPDTAIDCSVQWVGVPFVDPNMGDMVEFRVVELKHAQAIKDWQEKQLLREFGGDPDVRH